VPRLVRTTTTTAAAADGTWEARHDLVEEAEESPGHFVATNGPFAGYQRTVTVDGDRVTEVLQYRMAPAVTLVPYGLIFRWGLRRPARGRNLWWSPPEVFTPRAATAMSSLGAIAVVVGYLGTLLTQTVTFAADEFGSSKGDQSLLLAVVRVSVLATIVLTAVADRRGRRRVLLIGVTVGCVASAAGGLAPDLFAVGATQLVVRAVVTTCTVVLFVMVAEEMPAGARAYGVSLLGLWGAFGVGICLMLLPLADLGQSAWRVLYLLSLAGLPVVWWMARHLPESRRFAVAHENVAMAGHGSRLLLLALSAYLLNVFTAPASQLMNEFLRDERGYSATRISLFSLLTNTPGFIGVVVGARIADLRGRKGVGAIAVVGGCGLTAAMVLASGWSMWMLSLLGAIIGAAAIPALGVYGPELFPTSLRGRANGVIAVAAVLGAVSGLVAAGVLQDRWGGLGRPLALLSIGPLLMAGLVVAFYPETVHQELEEINPEDPRLDEAHAAIPET
jgi:MFS family permease